MQPRVAVIGVSFNTRDLLLECLRSADQAAADVGAEIVVIDNSSSDGSAAAVAALYPAVTLISNPENTGFAHACNQGIEATAAPFVLLLNSDATITGGGLKALLRCMEQHPRCAGAGCSLIGPGGETQVNTRNFLNPWNQPVALLGLPGAVSSKLLSRIRRPRAGHGRIDSTVDWIDGACLLLRRKALESSRPLDERFFMYSEDEDLCYRLRQRGWDVCFTCDGVAYHKGAASSVQNPKANLYQFYSSQSLFLLKHFGADVRGQYLANMRLALSLKLIYQRLKRSKSREADLSRRLAALEIVASESNL